MSADSHIGEFDLMTREAMGYVRDIMDEITGGCFKKGYRPATAIERVKEWDALTPESTQRLADVKGADWVYRHGSEIERLRKLTRTV